MSTLLRLFVAIYLCYSITGAPTNRRRWFYPAFLRDSDGAECKKFEKHPCNDVFNRTASERYAKFPNSRGMTLEGSMEEFAQYFTLFNLQPEGCYLEMWSLLCFHYFPQCSPTLPLRYIATPCRETCERARAGCEGFLGDRNISWPEHLDCSKFNSSRQDDLCVNSSADRQLVDGVYVGPGTPPTPTTPDEPTRVIVTDGIFTTETTESVTTITPAATPTNTPEPTTNLPCHSKCRYRTRANGGTFKNNNYTFAANVTVIRGVATRDPHHVYLAKITQFWALDDHNCSQFENHTLIVIRTSYSHCEACPDFNTTAGHNVYLVGGYCNNKGWYLPNTNSLVSPWHPHRVKYESKLQTWIQNAIEWRS